MTLYTQCLLVKGHTQQVSWIPAALAKLKHLKLKHDDGTWEDGWMVLERWQTLPEDKILSWRPSEWRSVTEWE